MNYDNERERRLHIGTKPHLRLRRGGWECLGRGLVSTYADAYAAWRAWLDLSIKFGVAKK